MRPQVVAHRGASHDNAEHTLAAYLAALDAGAEALECDVRLTADGHLVCVHDRNVRRTASTRGIVSTMELADLDDEAPERDEALDRVLTLRKLMETVADYHRPVELAIETKHPTRYAGLVERRVVDLLRDFGWDVPGAPVRVMSFSWTAFTLFVVPSIYMLVAHARERALVRDEEAAPAEAEAPAVATA